MASVQANVVGLVILSLMLLATITAVLHLIGRRIWTRRVLELETELARTNAKLDRTALMLRGESQILISWDRLDAEPTIEGDFALVADSPLSSRVLAFGSWLNPPQAAKIQEATERLLDPRRSVRRRRGQPARPPSRARRASGVRQRDDAHPRCFGRAPSIGAIARSIR